MNLLDKLNLDKWWNILLYIGIASIAASFFVSVDFVKNKYLFGLGVGLFMIGLSFQVAEISCSAIKPANAYTGGPALLSWKEIKHNVFTIIALLFGVALAGVFGVKIIIGLL